MRHQPNVLVRVGLAVASAFVLAVAFSSSSPATAADPVAPECAQLIPTGLAYQPDDVLQPAGLTVAGQTAYVQTFTGRGRSADTHGRLTVWDLAGASGLAARGSLDLGPRSTGSGGGARQPMMAAWAGRVYLVDLDLQSPLHVIDVSDPDRPRQVDDLADLVPGPIGVQVTAGRLAVLSQPAGGTLLLTILDLDRPGRPQVLGRLTLPDAWGILAAGEGWAYVLGQRQVHLVDLRSLPLATVAVPVRADGAASLNGLVAVPGGVVVVDGRSRGNRVDVVALPGPTGPAAAQALDGVSGAVLGAIGRRVLFGDFNSPVTAIDTSDLRRPQRLQLDGLPFGMAMPGQLADLGADEGLMITQGGLFRYGFARRGPCSAASRPTPPLPAPAAARLYLPLALQASWRPFVAPSEHLAMDVAGGPLYAAAVEDGLLVATVGSHVETFVLQADGPPVYQGATGDLGDALEAVATRQGLAAVATKGGELVMVDVSDPRRPMLVGRRSLSARAWYLNWDAAGAFALTGENQLLELDLSDPAAPGVKAELDIDGTWRGGRVAPLDGRLVVCHEGDVTESQLTVVGHAPDGGLVRLGDVGFPGYLACRFGLAALSGHAYVRSGYNLLAFDLRDPANIRQTAQVMAVGDSVLQSGSTLFMVDDRDSGVAATPHPVELSRWTLADPGQPAESKPPARITTQLAGRPQALAVWRDQMVLGVFGRDGWPGEGGFSVVDLAGRFPAASTPVGGIAAFPSVVVGGYALAADGIRALAPPAAPRRVASMPSTYDTWNATEVVGNRLYVAASDGFLPGALPELAILDISEPTAPRTLARYRDVPREPTGLHAESDLVVISGLYGTLSVISVADPARPRSLATLTVGQQTSALSAGGGYAYVAVGGGDYYGRDVGPPELVVVDLADATRPRLASRLPMAPIHDLERVGRHLFVSTATGLRVLDLADPLHPELLAARLPAFGALAPWRELLVVHDTDSLAVVDLSRPAHPRIVAWRSSLPYGGGGQMVEPGWYVVPSGDVGWLNLSLAGLLSPSRPRVWQPE